MATLDVLPSQSAPRRPRIAESVADLVGGTPLLRLTGSAVPDDVRLLAKLESANPLSSSKDRAALYMLAAAERRGDLPPTGGTVIEATSGNTGISLAALCAARGHICVIVLPDNATEERAELLTALGAVLERTPAADGYPGAIARAEQLHASTPGSWYVRQHDNPDNVQAHYQTTGPEIWSDTEGEIDILVVGVGTGGTLTGAGSYLRERNPRLQIVAAEPRRSPLLSQGWGAPHGIPGFNGGFIAPTTDTGLIDEVVSVRDHDAAQTARALAREHGLLVGVSSGAVVHAAQLIAARPDNRGRTVVVVLPDTGERYLSIWNRQAEDRDEETQ